MGMRVYVCLHPHIDTYYDKSQLGLVLLKGSIR
jgi:hypothetical protein